MSRRRKKSPLQEAIMNKTVATWIMFILPVALGLFYVKHIVQNLEEELSSLERSIDSDQAEVNMLRAEWAFQTKPQRIKKLANEYLDLKPTNAAQIADVRFIPHTQEASSVMTSSLRRNY